MFRRATARSSKARRHAKLLLSRKLSLSPDNKNNKDRKSLGHIQMDETTSESMDLERSRHERLEDSSFMRLEMLLGLTMPQETREPEANLQEMASLRSPSRCGRPSLEAWESDEEKPSTLEKLMSLDMPLAKFDKSIKESHKKSKKRDSGIAKKGSPSEKTRRKASKSPSPRRKLTRCDNPFSNKEQSFSCKEPEQIPELICIEPTMEECPSDKPKSAHKRKKKKKAKKKRKKAASAHSRTTPPMEKKVIDPMSKSMSHLQCPRSSRSLRSHSSDDVYTTLTPHLQDLENALEGVRKEKSNTSKEKFDLEVQYETEKELRELLEFEVERLKEEIEQHCHTEDTVTALRRTNDDISQTMRFVRADNSDLKDKLNRERRDQERALSRKEKEMQELNATIENIMEIHNVTAGENDHTLGFLQTELLQTKAKNRELEEQVSSLCKDLHQKDLTIMDLKANVSVIPSCDDDEDDTETLQIDNMNLEDRIRHKDEMIDHLMLQLEQVKSSVTWRRSKSAENVMTTASDLWNKLARSPESIIRTPRTPKKTIGKGGSTHSTSSSRMNKLALGVSPVCASEHSSFALW